MSSVLRNWSVQELQLELIRRSCRNTATGDEIADFLEDNRELWDAVMMTREFADLILLRDIKDGFWNANQVLVLTDVYREPYVTDALRKLGASVVGSPAGDVDELQSRLGFKPLGDTRVVTAWFE